MSTFTGQVQVDFVHDPTSASFTWVDITNRARAASYRRGRNYERDQVEAGTGTLKLRNDDGALDPTNGASTFAPNVLPFKRIQHNVTATGPGTVPIFTGLVERWPQEWDTGYGYAPVQVVDIFAWLSLSQLHSAYEEEVLADGPAAFYPLDEPNGATSAGDITGKQASATIQSSKYGAGTLTFGTTTPTMVGVTGSMAVTSPDVNTSAGALNSARATWLQVPNVVSAASSFAVEVWFLSPSSNNTIATEVILSAHAPPGASLLNGVELWIEPTFGSKLQISVAGGVFDVTSSNVICDGKWHHLVANINYGGTSTVYLDGVLKVSPATLAAVVDVNPWALGAQVIQQTGAVFGPYSGALAMFAQYPANLSAARITAHYNAGFTGFAGDTANARIARILGYAGWTAATALDTCTTTMLAVSDLAGKSALAAIQEVQASEGGVFYASKAGVLTYKSRRTRMQTTASVATFGENTAGGEVPYTNIALDFDPTYVYNDVQITRNGGANVSASDATSQLHYGQRTYSATFGTQSDVEAQDAANWTLYTSLAPHARVRSITVDALATPGAWAALLPLEVGSRVTVKRRPNNAAPVITVGSFVESIAWDIVDGRRAMCTLELSPIPVQALIADDATYGLCDSTFVAAW